MNSMSEPLSPTGAAASAAASTKPLWLAIGVLGVAVLGMGGVLIKGQGASPEAAPAVSTAAAVPAPATEPTVPAKPEQVITEKAEPAPVPPATQATAKAPVKPKAVNKPAQATQPVTPAVSPAVATTPPVATAPVEPTTSSAPAPAQPAVFQSQTKPLCINCGTVDSVTPVERGGHAVGVGAVAGGVLGAVVGNQIGQGNGRTVATILGALGGGLAGNTVEKNMKKTTQYEIRVRMEDGTLRTVEQATPLTAGTHVILDNGVLRAAPRVPTPVEQPTAVGQPAPAKVYSTQ